MSMLKEITTVQQNQLNPELGIFDQQGRPTLKALG